jgi:hypothetical protein
MYWVRIELAGTMLCCDSFRIGNAADKTQGKPRLEERQDSRKDKSQGKTSFKQNQRSKTMRQIIVLAACCFAILITVAPATASSYRHYGRAHAAHSYVVHPSRVADPAFTPNPLLDFYRRYNICAIDEGYGRATRCD